MARQSRISIAKKDIVALFDKAPQKVYSRSELGVILTKNRTDWRLVRTYIDKRFYRFLAKTRKTKSQQLSRFEIQTRSYPLLLGQRFDL